MAKETLGFVSGFKSTVFFLWKTIYGLRSKAPKVCQWLINVSKPNNQYIIKIFMNINHQSINIRNVQMTTGCPVKTHRYLL